jgi:hypothetical protein
VGTVAPDVVAWYYHTRHCVYDTFGGAMSGLHTYRVKARCMVDLYQYITADDVNVAVELALDAHNDWEVETLDDAEVKRVLEIERID